MKQFTLLMALVATLGLGACSNCKEPAKMDLKPGMKVVASWQGNSWWVGTIDSIDGDNVNLTYSDKTNGVKNKSLVLPHPTVQYTDGKPCCFKPGDKVVAKWKNDNWWVATIDKVEKDEASVTYSDGEKGTQKTTDIVRYNP